MHENRMCSSGMMTAESSDGIVRRTRGVIRFMLSVGEETKGFRVVASKVKMGKEGSKVLFRAREVVDGLEKEADVVAKVCLKL